MPPLAFSVCLVKSNAFRYTTQLFTVNLAP